MPTERFKIGSFNLYNLALPEVRFYGTRFYTGEEYQKKKKWIADQLGRMNADLVGFQEVFHQAALRDVLEASGLYDGATVLAGEERQEGPVVGLVSRFPVREHGFIADFPPESQIDLAQTCIVPVRSFSRPLLWARVELRPGFEVLVFVVHLKSKNPKIEEGVDRHDPLERAIGKARSLITRAAEATALRCILLDRLKGNDNAVIVMGDVNDAGQAVTSEIIVGSPPWRKLKYEVKRQVWDTLLYNVRDVQARQSYRDVYFTHIHNGHYESLDHILVSQEFVRENPNHLGQVEYVTVFNDHLVDDTLSEEIVPVWQSDHGQVVVTVRLR